MAGPRSRRCGRSPATPLVLMVGILLLAFGLRAYRLGAQSLWYDETVSVHLAGLSVPAMIAHTAGDIHPPGYYLLLHGWMRLAGRSDLAAAFLSLWFGVLLVALVYRLAACVFGRPAGVLAALLVAVSPYNLWYSQEVRMYTLAAALAVGVVWCVLRLTASPARAPAWPLLAAYAVCGALGLWVLYYFAFLLAAANLLVAAWWLAHRRRAGWAWLARWVLAQAAVLVLYAPWLPVAWRQATAPPVPPWRGFAPLGRVLLETWSALSLGQSARPAQVWPVLLLTALLFALGLLWAFRRTRPSLPPAEGVVSTANSSGDGQSLPPAAAGGTQGEALLLAGLVLLPVLLIYLASFVTPLYHVRYAFTYSAPFYALLAGGLAWLWQRWRPALWLGLAFILAASGASIYAYHTDPAFAGDDHRAAAAFLEQRWRPGDAILVDAGYAYTALLTYWHGDPIAWRGRLVGEAQGAPPAPPGGPVIFQAGTVDGPASLGWGDPASDFYAMATADTAAALSRLFADYDRVWVYRIYDTVTDPSGFIRSWLDEHGTPFENQVFSGEAQLRVQGFLTGRPRAGETCCVQKLADGSLALVGSSLRSLEAEAGGAVDLALDWQVGNLPDDGRILFAGLFDGTGQRWAQVDERPMGQLYPAVSWPSGAGVRTPLRLSVPAGTPPGSYALEVGWYRFVDGQPVWLPWTVGDRLLLGQVEVRAPGGGGSVPEVEQTAGVTLGEGLLLVGVNAGALETRPAGTVRVELVWEALSGGPEPGPALLQLADDAGRVVAEAAADPLDGRLPFAQMAAGQVVRDVRSLVVPESLAPGSYNLVVGRRAPDGTPLPVRRGPVALGPVYPLVTVHVRAPTGE